MSTTDRFSVVREDDAGYREIICSGERQHMQARLSQCYLDLKNSGLRYGALAFLTPEMFKVVSENSAFTMTFKIVRHTSNLKQDIRA